MTSDARRASVRGIIAGVVALAVLVPIGIGVVLVVPRRAKTERLSRAQETALRELHASRFDRPVLRGAPIEGNAVDAQARALTAFQTLDDASLFEGLGDALRDGRAPPPRILAVIERERAALAAYRAAARRSHARSVFDPRAPAPSVMGHLRASRLLLAQARVSEPAECLAILTDTLRLAQDRVAGQPLVPLMVLHAIARDALPVGAGCLARADASTLAAATRELAILARHPAPTASAFAAEAVFVGALYQDMVGEAPTIPYTPAGVGAWWQAGDALEAWERSLPAPLRRDLGADYPRDIVRWEAHERATVAMGNPLSAGSELSRYLWRDAGTRAIVRMLGAAARILAAPSRARPPLLDDPALSDPITGAPFTWTPTPEGARLSSPGPDRALGPDAQGETDDLALELVLP